jgi:glycosyltransferase involved in cell wall biosynthesis
MYLKHFVEALLGWDGCRVILFSPDWADLPFGAGSAFEDVRLPVPRNRALRVIYEQARYAAAVAGKRPDVFIGLNTAIPFNLRLPSAVLVKALQCFFVPGMHSFSQGVYLRSMVRMVARRADLLITPTRATAGDLRRVTAVPKSRIRVVPEALYVNREGGYHGEAEASARIAKLVSGRPFVLHVGATYAYKNLRRLIAAYALARRGQVTPHALLLVGAAQQIPFARLHLWAAEAGVEDEVVCAGRLSDQEVLACYRAADAMVLPSLYETFGHPVLEAMAHGCAVITSGEGALADVAGGAAERVNVRDISDLAAGIKRVVGNPVRRAELIEAGRVRAAQFTWANTMNGIREIIDELLATRH